MRYRIKIDSAAMVYYNGDTRSHPWKVDRSLIFEESAVRVKPHLETNAPYWTFVQDGITYVVHESSVVLMHG